MAWTPVAFVAPAPPTGSGALTASPALRATPPGRLVDVSAHATAQPTTSSSSSSTLNTVLFAAAAVSAGRVAYRHRAFDGKVRRGGRSALLPRVTRAAVQGSEALGKFKRAQIMTFIGMLLGYATYYCTRLSFNFVGPALRADLGYNMMQIGAITSIFPIAYMNSKFIAGILSDLLGSPVMIFGLGMAVTGLLNIGFSMGSSIPWLTFFWVANGLFQGCGGSPCGKMLVAWFPTATRGKWWSTWAASANIGGFIIPTLAGATAAQFGWRWGMRAPGFLALVMGLVSYFIMKDSPEKAGLPSCEEAYLMSTGAVADQADEGKEGEAAKAEEEDADANTPITTLLLQNKFLWCMAAMQFTVYFMRQGIMNWAVFYMIDQFGLSTAEAATRLSGFELGGFFGAILSGQISDWLIARNPDKGAAGMRARTMLGFALLSPIAALAFWMAPPVRAIQFACLALLGLSIYGPVTLITMTGAETVPPRLAASTAGVLGYPAQAGAVFAGLPFAIAFKKFGWNGFFPILIVLGIITALIVTPGMNALSYQQQLAQKRKASSKA